MKNLFKTTMITSCMIFTGIYSHAQAPAGTTAPIPADLKHTYASMPPPRPGQPGPMMDGHRPTIGLQQLTAINGKVTGYLANDRYEYDALTLQTGSNQVNIKFPAHLASQLMRSGN